MVASSRSTALRVPTDRPAGDHEPRPGGAACANARTSASRFLRGSMPPTKSAYGPSTPKRRRTSSTALGRRPARTRRRPRPAAPPSREPDPRDGRPAGRCASTSRARARRRPARATPSKRRRHRASMCGAVSGSRSYARSCTTITTPGLARGGRQEVRGQQHVEVHRPLRARHAQARGHRLEHPGGEPRRALGQVRRRHRREELARGGRAPSRAGTTPRSRSAGSACGRWRIICCGVMAHAGAPGVERRPRIDHRPHARNPSGSRGRACADRERLSRPRRGSGRPRSRRCTPSAPEWRTSTLRPRIDPVSPWTSAMRQPSITIESATALRTIRQSRSIETSGPSVRGLHDGARDRSRAGLAGRCASPSRPRPPTTSPSIRVASSTSPCTANARTESIIRFASSRSSGLPVSFHQPSTISARTVRPWSTSHWIASVISYSPRHDGSSVAHASRIGVVEQVDAHEREVARRTPSASPPAARRARPPARPRRTARAPARAPGRSARPARLRSNSSTNRVTPSSSTLSPRYSRNGSPAHEVGRRQHRVREPERRGLRDVGDVQPPPRSVAHRGAHLVARGADHDAHLGDARRRDGLERVEQDRRAGDGDQLLRVRVGERPEAGALPAGQDQRAHQPVGPTHCDGRAAVVPGADLGRLVGGRHEDRHVVGQPLDLFHLEPREVLLHDLGLHRVPGRVRDHVAGDARAVARKRRPIPGEMSNPLSDRTCPTLCAPCRPRRGRSTGTVIVAGDGGV